MQAKASSNQNASKTQMTSGGGMSKTGGMGEKSGVKDIGLQSIGSKSNPMTNTNTQQ